MGDLRTTQESMLTTIKEFGGGGFVGATVAGAVHGVSLVGSLILGVAAGAALCAVRRKVLRTGTRNGRGPV